MTWNLVDIAKAVNGTLLNTPDTEVEVSGVFHDTRKIKKGSLFVPIIAQRDGHDFIQAAIDQGAATAFWSKDAKDAPVDFPVIHVEDTEKALRDFSIWYLNKVQPQVVGITGSNGKTTTKDMTAAVLATKYRTHQTAGNFNNQLGVPLTILAMPEDTEILVVEMGMSEPGEIEFLSKIAQPDLAAITMIGESHIEAFGSRAKIAEEKLGILEGLKAEGTLIYPENESLIKERLPNCLQTKTFGHSETADLYAVDMMEETEETRFSVVQKDGEKINFTLPVPGSYNVQNALLAILIGQAFDVSLEEAKIGLAQLELTKNRLEWLDGKNGIRLLNDAYNASPTSIQAVLRYFSEVVTPGEKIVVLGDVLELGALSKKMHEDLSSAIALKDFKAVFLYGPEMKYLYEKLADEADFEKVSHFEGDKKQLIEAIKAKAKSGDLVLFKSSNGTGLLDVVAELVE